MFIVYILIAILMFGFLIAIHELGHFVAAKSLGVRVNEFSIGMGPKVFSRQKGETVYSLRAFPVGGFCAMEGEEEDSSDPRSFNNKSGWKKLIILVAGAFMNFVAGVVIILLIFTQAEGFVRPVVTDYNSEITHAAQIGILPGDELYRIDGHRIYNNNDAHLFLGRSDGDITLEVLRDGQKLDLGLVPLHKTVTEEGDVYEMGIRLGQTEAATLGNTLRYTWFQAVDYVRIVWISLGDLVTGAVGLKDLSGPIAIVNTIGEAGAASPNAGVAMMNILNIVAFIAINLAVMNLLPIPALDGGQILFVIVGGAYRLVTRRQINQKYFGYINMAGFFCLIALMVVVAVNDVIKLF